MTSDCSGRRGVLSMNAVATMEESAQIEVAMRQVMAFTSFADGHAYSDFDPHVDKVAAVGIATLIAGGAMAKGGIFKVLGALLMAGKKFVVLAVVGIGVFVRRLFGRGEQRKAAVGCGWWRRRRSGTRQTALR